MTLKTDYKDDVLDLTQNANRKFQEIENQDGSISFNDVTVYETTGDTFGASDANAITRALTDTTRGISFQFGIDGNGDYGYIKDGESEVTPFRNRHTETITPNSRTTVDMGEFHKKRYVDLSAVPNVNTQVAYFTQNTGGNYDLGEANNYRYVNVNVSISGSAGWVGENITNTTNSVNIGGLTSGSKYIITAVSSNQAVPEISGGATVLAQSSSFPAYSAQQQIRTFYLQATATTINITNAGRYTCFKILP